MIQFELNLAVRTLGDTGSRDSNAVIASDVMSSATSKLVLLVSKRPNIFSWHCAFFDVLVSFSLSHIGF